MSLSILNLVMRTFPLFFTHWRRKGKALANTVKNSNVIGGTFAATYAKITQSK